MSRASVSVDAQRFASINKGLVIFLAIGKHDSASDVSYVVKKISNLRIFPNSDGKFDISALEVKAELLVISQFTLFAETRRGRRPSFYGSRAQSGKRAIPKCSRSFEIVATHY